MFERMEKPQNQPPNYKLGLSPYCQFCSPNKKATFLTHSSDQHDKSASLNKLHQTETLVSKQEQQSLEFSRVPSAHLDLSDKVNPTIREEEDKGRGELSEKDALKQEIFQLSICRECCLELKKLHQELEQKKVTQKLKINKVPEEQPIFAKKVDQPPQKPVNLEEEKKQTSFSQQNLQHLELRDTLSDLIYRNAEIFHEKNKDYALDTPLKPNQFDDYSLGLNSYASVENKVKSKPSELPLKEDGLGIESKLDISLDDSFDEEKMMKKFVVEGFPKKKAIPTLSGHRSISIFIEKEKIKVIRGILATVYCQGCGYEVEKSNFFSVWDENRQKKLCRLCYTLSESTKKTISFDKKEDQGEETERYRTKRAETITKNQLVVRNRIISSPVNDPKSVEKSYLRSRKQMIPREKLNKKNISRRTVCEVCRKAVATMRKLDSNVCLNCFYQKRKH